MAVSLAIYCGLGPCVDALLERLTDNPAIASILPVAVDAAGESLIWRGRPVAVRAPEDVVVADIAVAVFLDNDDLAERCIDPLLDADALILDATGSLAQRGQGRWYFGGELDSSQRQLSIAGTAASHCAALLSLLGQTPVAVNAAVCLPVSCHGKKGIDALAYESARLLNGQPIDKRALGQQIAFNVVADQNGLFASKIEQQLAEYFDHAADVRCHVVIAPVFYGHNISLMVDCGEPIDYSGLLQGLGGNARFRLASDVSEQVSPASLPEELGIDIADIRLDRQSENRLRCTLIGDNLRDGAVTNIASALEILIKNDI